MAPNIFWVILGALLRGHTTAHASKKGWVPKRGFSEGLLEGVLWCVFKGKRGSQKGSYNEDQILTPAKLATTPERFSKDFCLQPGLEWKCFLVSAKLRPLQFP